MSKQQHKPESTTTSKRIKSEVSDEAVILKNDLMKAIKHKISKGLEDGFKKKLSQNEDSSDMVLTVLGKEFGYIGSSKGQGAWAGTFPTLEGAKWVDMQKKYETYEALKVEHANAPLAAPKPKTDEDKIKALEEKIAKLKREYAEKQKQGHSSPSHV